MVIDSMTGKGRCMSYIILDVFHEYGTGTTVDPCQLIYRMIPTKVKIDGKWEEGEPCQEHIAVDIKFPDGTFVNRIAEVWFSGSTKNYNEPAVIVTKHHIGDELMSHIVLDVREKLGGRCSSPSPAGDDDEELSDSEDDSYFHAVGPNTESVLRPKTIEEVTKIHERIESGKDHHLDE